MMKKIIILTCIFTVLFSCNNPTCEDYAILYRSDSCIMVVQKIPEDIVGSFFNYEGFHPYTHKKCSCQSELSYRRWAEYSEHIHVGDTIIKEKGKNTFFIHQKDTILSFEYECYGTVYK